MPPTGNASQGSSNSASISTGIGGPVKNQKSVRISQLNSGFLIEKTNVNNYGMTNDVALDLEGAMKIANEYFA